MCQKCKTAAATVCVTQVADSKKTDIYLCQKCANESAAAKLKAAFGYLDAMPGHLVFGTDSNPYLAQSINERCPGCGMTFSEIQKDGKLGCANCYTAFRAKLRPIVTRIHRSAQHRGKSPRGGDGATASGPGAANADAVRGAAGTGINNAPDSGMPAADVPAGETPTDNLPAGETPTDNFFDGIGISHEERLEKLKSSLIAAIREEEYEKAAVIRDQIKAIEK